MIDFVVNNFNRLFTIVDRYLQFKTDIFTNIDRYLPIFTDIEPS